MDLQVNRLDRSLAVEAWKTLWIEASTWQTRADKVWLPTRHLLDKTAENPPKKFVCFAGKEYMFPNDSDGVAVKLFFIGENRVAYLGTLKDPIANQVDRQREVDRLRLINLNMANTLKQSKLNAIIRDAAQLGIPADSSFLDTATATRAVQRYLAIWSPKLLAVPIEWLKPKDADVIINAIRTEAEQTARYPTNEEDLLARHQDEQETFELWD
ncbi:MAG TPA: hypothetical protein VI937_02090 [Negativicutes bacterium]|nr:hypothetical protein [Negativicutes bacterium]